MTLDKKRLTAALLTLMAPGSSEGDYDGPTGTMVCGWNLDQPNWGLASAESMAEDIIEAYESRLGAGD